MAIFGFVEGTVYSVDPTDWKGAIVSIEQSALDRKGRPITTYVDIRVSPEHVEQGLHNTYRQLIGKSVFAPVSFGIYQKELGSKAFEQVELVGLPRRLNEAAKPAPTQQAS